MRGRWHILFGAIFAFAVWLYSPGINLIYVALLFLSSFLIDLDHYMAYFLKTKDFSFSNFFVYHKKKRIEEVRLLKAGIKKKGDFHLFHTIEFHVLIGVIGIFSAPFFYMFIGLVFHSLTDVIDMARRGVIHRREYFFFKWLRRIAQ